MFENYGIRDVFIGIWKFKWMIAIVLIISVLFGTAYGTRVKEKTFGGENEIWSTSASFFVTSTEQDTVKDEMFDRSGDITNTYVTLLTSDFSKQYVLDNILTKYSKEDIIKRAHIGGKPEDLNMHVLASKFNVSRLPSSTVINMYVEIPDKELSGDILKAYTDCLTKFLREKVNQGRLTYIDGTQQIVGAENGAAMKSVSKYVIIFSMAAIVLSLIAVFIITLVSPTINRKSDFYKYNVKYIGNMYGAKKGERK